MGSVYNAAKNEMQHKLLLGIADGLNVSEAGRQAGYTKPQAAHRSLQSMRQRLPELLERLGCPVEKVFKKLIDQLDAKETKFFADKGLVTDEKEVIAHDIQHRAAVRLADIYGAFPKQTNNTQVNVNLPVQVFTNVSLPDA